MFGVLSRYWRDDYVALALMVTLAGGGLWACDEEDDDEPETTQQQSADEEDAPFDDGEGTEESPWEIATAD